MLDQAKGAIPPEILMPEGPPLKCVCLVPHPDGSSLLVRRTDEGFICLQIDLPWQRLEFFPDYVPHIRRTIAADTGIEATVLRHLRHRGDLHFCLLEVQSLPDDLPAGYEWHNPAEATVPDELSQEAWLIWKNLPQTADQSRFAPWERIGWFTEAKGWMEAQLAERGYEAGPIEQLKGAWSWSSILTAATNRGRVFFKADYAKPPQEVEIVLKLADRWPDNVPHIIGSDTDRGWMLMSDFGGVSVETLGPDHYHKPLSRYAEIQRSTAPEIDQWSALGCPDMTPENLIRVMERLLADDDVLRGGPNGLNEDEFQELARLTTTVRETLSQLANSPLPPVISNEDFRAGNIVHTSTGYLFYDWSGVVITHPFFGINYFLNRMVRGADDDGFRWRNELYDPCRRSLADTFLTHWTGDADLKDLTADFWRCRRLSFLYEALRIYQDLPYLDDQAPWGAGSLNYIPHAVRSHIAAFRPPT